jgi:predicted ABC-type ATPase
MAKAPKLRIIAGPNGSGKSNLIKELRSKFYFGHYLNADDIEKELKKTGCFDFSSVGIKSSTSEILKLIKKSGLQNKIETIDFKIENNIFYYPRKLVNSYVSLIIVQYLIDTFIKNSQTFSFETVMSHSGKLDIMKQAKANGFRIYLYYICTQSPKINQERVKQRVALGGHNVEAIKIKDRYYKSLENLYPALKLSNRGFIFDNSSKEYILMAETIEGERVHFKQKTIPSWIVDALKLKTQKKT